MDGWMDGWMDTPETYKCNFSSTVLKLAFFFFVQNWKRRKRVADVHTPTHTHTLIKPTCWSQAPIKHRYAFLNVLPVQVSGFLRLVLPNSATMWNSLSFPTNTNKSFHLDDQGEIKRKTNVLFFELKKYWETLQARIWWFVTNVNHGCCYCFYDLKFPLLHL